MEQRRLLRQVLLCPIPLGRLTIRHFGGDSPHSLDTLSSLLRPLPMPRLLPSAPILPHGKAFSQDTLWLSLVVFYWVFAIVLPIFAQIAIRRFFMILHRRTSPALLLSHHQPDPYETSIWDALERPTAYLLIFVIYHQGIISTVPTAIISTTVTKYILQSWRGAVVVYITWFLYRYKTNFFLKRGLLEIHEDNMMIGFEKLLSLSCIALGVICLAEVYHIPVQSIVTFGGMGGAATTFVAKDLFKNFLSGLYLQIAKPFAIGNHIKVGTVEGRVKKIGITSTSLNNSNGSTVIVPNSFFCSQVTVVAVVKETPRTSGVTPRVHDD